MPIKMEPKRLVIVVAVLSACSRSATTPAQQQPAPRPPTPAITHATFEPVYRSAKALQGALTAGVSYVKFGELLQGFSTEIGIAKDHTLTQADKTLLDLYEQAFTDYEASATLWTLKNKASDDMWKGEIPVTFRGKTDPAITAIIKRYELQPIDRVVALTHANYAALPSTSIQQIWSAADAKLEKATAIYYGRDGSSAQ